jgi:hypothetical protein
MGVDPIAQSDFLLVSEMAAAALVAERLQPFNAALPISASPSANRVVVQKQSRCDTFAAPALVEKDDGVRPARNPMLREPIPRYPDQGLPVFG